MNRIRMTVVHEFDYHGDLDQNAIDRLRINFLVNPTGFLHPETLECDEVLMVGFEAISGEE